MPVLHSVVFIDAPLPSVAAAVREVGVLRRATAGVRRIGARSELEDGALLGHGDQVCLRVRLAPGVRLPLRLQVTAVTLERLESVLVAGPLPRLAYTGVLTRVAGGTHLTEGVDWTSPPGVLGRVVDVVLGRVAGVALRCHAEQVKACAEQIRAAPTVVAAAVVKAVSDEAAPRSGRWVLAQQRAHPAVAAGRWELPGGRVEPGESVRDALVRECREELAVEVVPGEQLGPDVPLPSGHVLRGYAARLADPAACPVPVEHAALRWVDTSEFAGLDWLDADRALLPDLAALLRPGPVP